MNLFLPVSIRISKLGSPRTNLLGTERSLFVHQLPPELPALILCLLCNNPAYSAIPPGESETSLRGSFLPNISGARTWGRKGGIQGISGGARGDGEVVKESEPPWILKPPPEDTDLHRGNRNRSTCHLLSIRYCGTPIYLSILNPHTTKTVSLALFYRQGNWGSEGKVRIRLKNTISNW